MGIKIKECFTTGYDVHVPTKFYHPGVGFNKKKNLRRVCAYKYPCQSI